MRLKLRMFSALVVVLAATLGLVACGGGDDNETSGATTEQFTPVTTPPDNAKKGGHLTVIAAGDVDYLDPGAGYYQFTYQVDYAWERALMGWPSDETEAPQPDLADGDPTVSEDGKTLTFKIKPVKYQPPVNREIKAADFKYAIERGLLPGVATSYIKPYFGDLVGYDAAVKAVEKNKTVAPNITGITTPDDQTLVLKFTEPVVASAQQALSLPLGTPVPEEYAKQFDAKSPSTYGQYVVGTGPYMVENDDSGKLTGYTPGKEIKMVRNPNWDPDLDYRPAYLDSITIQEGFENTTAAARKILTGDSMVNGDFGLEAPSLKEAATKYPDQLMLAGGPTDRYIALNTTIPPFDDLNVRKAVLAGFDRDALRLTRGGEIIGPIMNQFLMPGVPGFEEAGGLKGTGVDFLASETGNPQLAAEYFKKAGYKSGKYEGNETLLMVGDDTGPGRKTAEVALDQFEKLGFNVDFRPVTHDTMYTRFCNVPKSDVAICPNVGWVADFRDGQAVLDPTFNGNAIVPVNNSNWPQLDVPAVNKAIDKAKLIVDPDEREQAWAEASRLITAQAPAIPWVFDKFSNIGSTNVAMVINANNADVDLSYTSLKNP